MQVIYLFFSVLEFKFLDMILRKKTLFEATTRAKCTSFAIKYWYRYVSSGRIALGVTPSSN